MPGKLVPALQAKGVNWGYIGANLTSMTTDLPAPHLVPILCTPLVVISDSHGILEWLDNEYPDGPSLFPSEAVRALDREISDVFSCFTRYFNLIDDEGFRSGMGQALLGALPCCCRCWCVLDCVSAHHSACHVGLPPPPPALQRLPPQPSSLGDHPWIPPCD